jgi:hypothetical protein
MDFGGANAEQWSRLFLEENDAVSQGEFGNQGVPGSRFTRENKTMNNLGLGVRL